MDDAEFEKRGFTKIFIPELNRFGWSMEMDFELGDDILETENIDFLKQLLAIHLEDAEPEDYQMAARIRDRIKELNGDVAQ